ncbi:PREDICTED: uncharacterized protein LOC104815133 [Tarenaya hassleriana]|uniref:uncharacterized protein LOC104815133 n=1 Tax=Tarenaya hassleriana TaxID=28532 RepID=UPI00053C722F|nr:PREDICTED: uncharacterized protein LOC104815133 [Tarenaya hassleriana]
MGKKGSGGWFSTVKKKVFKSSSKDSKRDGSENNNNGDRWQQHEAQEVVSFEHFPAESSPELSHDVQSTASTPAADERKHAMAGATIDDYEMQAKHGHRVMVGFRKQVEEEENRLDVQNRNTGVVSDRQNPKKLAGVNRTGIYQNFGKEKERSEGMAKRERALAYAYSYQRQKQGYDQPTTNTNTEGIGLSINGPDRAQWAWNWLDHWMSSQSYTGRNLGPVPYNPPPYPNFSAASATTIPTDNVSEKTVEMDVMTPASFKGDIMDMVDPEFMYLGSNQQAQYHRKSPVHVPSYMAQTVSAKAKVRGHTPSSKPQHVPHWNLSTKAGSGCDSSSSGYTIPRSPNPKAETRRKPVSPTLSPTGEGWRTGGGVGRRGRRHDLG